MTYNNELKNTIQINQAEIEQISNSLKEKVFLIQTLKEKKLNFEKEKEKFYEKEKLTKSTSSYALPPQDPSVNKIVQELKRKLNEKETELILEKERREAVEKSPSKSTTNNMNKMMEEHQKLLDEYNKLRNDQLKRDEDNFEINEQVSKLKQENETMQEQLKMAEKRLKEKDKPNHELMKMQIEIELLKEEKKQLEAKMKITSPDTKKDLLDLLDQLKKENLNLSSDLTSLTLEHKEVLKNINTIKQNVKNLESEKENLQKKIKDKNEQINSFSTKLSKLEVDLVNTKQVLGETLNIVNELEQEKLAWHHNLN